MFAVKKLICGEDAMLDLYMVIVLLSCFVLCQIDEEEL